jgi:hypothetical protein
MIPTQSYLKVHYELRSAKQVERRMLIDALQTLSALGFDIPEYQYTGFGSIYFVDFVLFHKYLGIKRMWSVEHDVTISKRIRFNRPFSFVRIFMKDAAEVIAQLPGDRRHLLWLDYDSFISSTLAEHAYLALSRLSTGSILLLTVDVEPPLQDPTPARVKQHFVAEVERHLPPKPRFASFQLPHLNLEVLKNICRSAVSVRSAVSFQPLFSFLYKDGHQMLTFGGMLVGDEERAPLNTLRNNPALTPKYMKFSWKDAPFEIVVPRLTRKERIYLEGLMPVGTKDWVPANFELSAKEVQAYRDIYRFFPVYAELAL